MLARAPYRATPPPFLLPSAWRVCAALLACLLLGATRAAVRAEQRRLGLAADAWPTPELLARLR